VLRFRVSSVAFQRELLDFQWFPSFVWVFKMKFFFGFISVCLLGSISAAPQVSVPTAAPVVEATTAVPVVTGNVVPAVAPVPVAAAPAVVPLAAQTQTEPRHALILDGAVYQIFNKNDGGVRISGFSL